MNFSVTDQRTNKEILGVGLFCKSFITLTPPSRARSEQVPTPEFLKKFHLKGDIFLKIAMDILASYKHSLGQWMLSSGQGWTKHDNDAFKAPDMSWHQLGGPHPEHGEGGGHAEAEK